MTNKGPSKVAIALVGWAALTSAVACSDDKNDDGPAAAGQAGKAGASTVATSGSKGVGEDSMAGAPSGSGGKGSGGETVGGDDVDYTMCTPQECDPDAALDFDFSKPWNESLVYTSNDCAPGLQSLLPPGFEMKDITFSDVIVGKCFRNPDTDMYTGSVETDLSAAAYCATSKYPAGDPVGDIDLVSHVKWSSIETDKITGKSPVYLAQAGCTLVGDYTLTRAE